MYVVITGASRGIGYELAKVYASHKYDLILTCKNNIEKLNNLKKQLEDKYNINIKTIKGNILEENIDNIDDIYILINNASISNYKMLIDVDENDFDEIVNNNIKNVVFNTKIIIKKMLKYKQGVILNISSIWGIVGSSLESLYSMSKGAINSFTKSVAKEYMYSNIDCISLALGMVDTDMNNHLTNEEKNEIINSLSNKKMFTPNEIAVYIYDLLKNHNYKTGDIIIKNNGLK